MPRARFGNVRLLPLLAGLCATAGALLAAPPGVRVLAEELVIKGVCAWPKLVLLPDGQIAAAIYNQPGHVQLLEGDVACWASADGGVTWEFRGNTTRHAPGTARVNHAIGLAGDGALVAAASGWTLVRNDDGTFRRGELLRPVASRSTDGGRTWRISEEFPDAPDGQRLIPFGNIERGADGRLRVAAYSFTRGVKPRVDRCYAVASADDGVTWQVQSLVGAPDANETDLLHLGGGHWLAAARNLGDPQAPGHSIDVYASDDDAATWRRVSRVTAALEHPGDLVQTADGRIILAYGDRRPGHYGVCVRVSRDRGLTWSEPVTLTQGVQTRDCGYPSTVQLRDGTLVTAYYSKKSTRHDGYHMAVVRWRLAED